MSQDTPPAAAVTPAASPVDKPVESGYEMLEQLRAKQDFMKALAMGLLASIVGAALWATITVLTDTKLGLVAIAIGLIVGFAVRRFGQGVDVKFSVLGGALSLFGCALGNLLSAVGFIASYRNVGFFDLLSGLDLHGTLKIMEVTFSPMDLLFYAISIHQGFKRSREVR